MSWLAISDGTRPLRRPAPVDGLLATGSIVIDTEVTGDQDTGRPIIALERSDGWQRRFRLTLDRQGTLELLHRQAGETTIARLSLQLPERAATLRLTYAWDAPRRRGFLSAHDLDTGKLTQTLVTDPQPWPMDDVDALVSGISADMDPGTPPLSMVAVSDRIEPVGLAPGFPAEAMIDTGAGRRQVSKLAPGDLVMTAQGGWQQVRWVTRHELPAVGHHAPLRLRAPYFGLDQDIDLVAGHRILIDGADAEYLFGTDSVLVEARHLAHMACRPAPRGSETRGFVQIILDHHDCIRAAGTWAETLYLGDLADQPPGHIATALAEMPGDALPRHGRITRPLLKSYEAAVLVSALCA